MLLSDLPAARYALYYERLFAILSRLPRLPVRLLRGMRPSGSGQELELIYDSNNRSEGEMRIGFDVHSGVFGFDDIRVDRVVAIRYLVWFGPNSFGRQAA